MTGMCADDDATSSSATRILGWREWLSLPGLGIAAIRAKIDSGARSSALHVDHLHTWHEKRFEWVGFSLDPTGAGTPINCRARIRDRRPVTDSGGHTTERIFIRTDLLVAGRVFSIELNLANRRNMLFPMLLGRTAMIDRFLIDPSASFLLGTPASPDTPR